MMLSHAALQIPWTRVRVILATVNIMAAKFMWPKKIRLWIKGHTFRGRFGPMEAVRRKSYSDHGGRPRKGPLRGHTKAIQSLDALVPP